MGPPIAADGIAAQRSAAAKRRRHSSGPAQNNFNHDANPGARVCLAGLSCPP